jgi:Mn2+/Fe2+ NRAMP family transporter
MNFRRSPRLPRISRHLLPLFERRPREGSPENRGKVVAFPAEKQPAIPRFLERYARQTTFMRRVLPGIVSGVADVDPALVLTATAVGVAFGYQMLWVVLLCLPFLLTLFSVSGRVGFETRRGLVSLLRKNYGAGAALSVGSLVVGINMLMIVADLLAVTEALSIILDQRRIFFVTLVAFAVWYVLIFGRYQKLMRSLALLSLPLFVYVLAAFAAQPPLGTLLSGAVVPRLHADASYTMGMLATFGALLTPYVLVWQTSSRRETAVTGGSLHESEHRMGAMLTTLLCFCVMLVAATVLRSATGIEQQLTVRRAAEALSPAFGDLGPVLFSLGIIGAGMVALPVLVASLCYTVSEAFGWESGLSNDPWEARRFYGLISGALVVAAAANFFRLQTINVVYASQIAAGVIALPILVFVLMLANDRRVMKTVNSPSQNFWIGAAVGGITATVLVLVWAAVR